MIEPVAYQKRLEGKSNAHLITFSDGNDYVVKYVQQGFEKSLPNEWVSYCLARYLGLPIPYARIVQIPAEFSLSVPELAQMKLTNNQFASKYIPNCSDGHEVSKIEGITNHKVLSSTILFDYWLCNTDRTRKNILLHEQSPHTYELWAIDHAEVFGTYNWQRADLEALPVFLLKSGTHQLMARFIEDEENFHEQLELIKTMPILLMEEIVDLIPEDWDVTKEERKEIISTLLYRRKKVLPELMKKFLKNVYQPIQENQT